MRHPECKPSLTKKEFIEESMQGSFPPLYKEIPYGSPAGIYPDFAGPESFLFESVKGPEKIARYSFIGFEPYISLRLKDKSLDMTVNGKRSLGIQKPLQKLSDILISYRQKPKVELPLFQGGVAGLFNYDFVHYLERLPKTALDDLKLPDAHFFVVDRLLTFDHKEKKAWAIVCPGLRDATAGLDSIYDEAEHTLNSICSRLGTSGEVCGPEKGRSRIEIGYEMPKEDYMSMVRRAKEYIAAGDIFQANLSQRLSALIGDRRPWELYQILSEINPSPFAGFMDFGDYHIVSSSPERLVRVKDGVIETRPIAGTRPRGIDNKENERMRSELLLNEKERAEHIMLIDLERNDIGRVSDYGSVTVDELMITEDYSHVIHIVSNVRGMLAKNRTTVDVIKAVFPGGTITGVPKVRCMEIIDELEPVRRGPYTGSMGYIGFNGNMDLNIIIRTFLIKDGCAYVQAGAGIVADSDPEREYYETLKKAEALLMTLERV